MASQLLDTDTISFYLKGVPRVKPHFDAAFSANERPFVSIMSYYEVMNGLIFKDAHRQMESFKELIESCEILFLNVEIAELAAKIYAELRKSNQMIGHYDVLIGATALHYDLKVVTNNASHFSRIPGLILENWL